MPIDPRIILGIQAPQFKVADPLESAHKSLALQALMGQQELQAMQMRQAQQAEADDLATREAFKQGGDRAAIVQRLMQSGQYKPAQALEKYGLEADKTRGEINKTRIEGMGKLLDFQKQAAGAVLANPTAENALQMIDQGERLATSLNFPEQAAAAAQQRAQVQALANDPEGLRRLVAGWAISADKLLPQFQTRNTGGSTDTLAIDPVTGKVSVTNTVANTATPDAIMTDKRTREEGAKDRSLRMTIAGMSDARQKDQNAIMAGRNAREDMDALRKEFDQLPEVKNYKAAYPAFAAVKDAASRDTLQSDINLIYGLAKLYDPTSVVREGEYATVANNQAIPERLKGIIRSVGGGAKLTPETRAQIMREAEGRIAQYEDQYGKARGSFEGITSKRGYDASQVFPDTGRTVGGKVQAAPAQPAPGAMPALPKGVKFLGFE